MCIGINEVWFVMGVDASLGVSWYVLVSVNAVGDRIYIVYVYGYWFSWLDPTWVSVERLLGTWARSGYRIPARSSGWDLVKKSARFSTPAPQRTLN